MRNYRTILESADHALLKMRVRKRESESMATLVSRANPI
jgi:hypothetical protein